MNYPAGAFEALLERESRAGKFESAYQEGRCIYAAKLRECAKSGQPVTRVGTHEYTVGKLLEEDLDSATMRQSIESWMAGDMKRATELMVSAYEKALEDSIEFLATRYAEDA